MEVRIDFLTPVIAPNLSQNALLIIRKNVNSIGDSFCRQYAVTDEKTCEKVKDTFAYVDRYFILSYLEPLGYIAIADLVWFTGANPALRQLMTSVQSYIMYDSTKIAFPVKNIIAIYPLPPIRTRIVRKGNSHSLTNEGYLDPLTHHLYLDIESRDPNRLLEELQKAGQNGLGAFTRKGFGKFVVTPLNNNTDTAKNKKQKV